MLEQFEHFHFLRPEWFLALIPALSLVIWLFRRKGNYLNWNKFCDKALLEHLAVNCGVKQRRSPALLLAIAWLITIAALAGPSWEKLKTPLYSSKNSLVIILDLSQSMNSEDLKPSRLARARHKLTDLLSQRDEGQTALIVYAGDSHVVSPLTADSKTILSMVPILNSNLMPVPGSNLEQALDEAVKLFKNAGEVSGKILLLTDGIAQKDNDKLIEAAKKTKNAGYRLSIIGIGSKAGAPIPNLEKGGYLKDKNGNIFITKLPSKQLKDLAATGGGKYHQITISDRDIKNLLSDKLQNQYEQLQNSNQQTVEEQFKQDQWQDEGAYLVLLLIPLAVLAFRRGWLLALLVFIIPFPQPSYALSWDDLWLRADQQGQQAFNAGKHQQAAEKFADADWQGSSYYKAGQYKKALQAYKRSQTADAYYNQGNTLAQMNKLEDAVKAYQQALKKDPDHQDSQKNKKVVEDLIEQQKQQQKQQQNQQQKNSDQQEKNDQQKQDQEQKQQSGDKQQDDKQSQQEQESQQQSEDQNKNEKSASDAEQDSSEDPKESQSQGKQKQLDPQQQESLQAEQQKETKEDEKQPLETHFSKLSDEEKQSMQHYLQQIPDDPSYLLKRKFYLNSRRNPQQQEANPW